MVRDERGDKSPSVFCEIPNGAWVPMMGYGDPDRMPQKSSSSGCGGGPMGGKPKTRSGCSSLTVLSAQGQDQVPEDRPILSTH